MVGLSRGRYSVTFSTEPAEVERAQRLRHATFIASRPGARREGARAQGLDADAFDPLCIHALVEERATGRLVCCFRMMHLLDGSAVDRTYSAQHYGLDALRTFPAPMVEMGRFCIAADVKDPDVLRVAWGAMTKWVEDNRVELLFGCSSFEGVDADTYADAFAYLKERHIAPPRWLPRVKAPKVFEYARNLGLRRPDVKLALKRMPPLLRTYLTMGGWVSDHAVIDNDLNTLHVFTAVEIARVPQRRRQLLRAAGGFA